ncbi:M16 family metallopeptidase [Sphingomonas lacunae]
MLVPMSLNFLRRVALAFAASSLVVTSPAGASATDRGAVGQANVPTADSRSSVDRTPWLYVGSDIPPDRGWQFGALGNGLRFAVRRNGVPPGQVTIRLRVDAGSLMEQPHEAGWAHLIEHLSFRESRYLQSGEARREWQRLGVSFGSDSNATTGTTATVYQLDIPAATPESVAQSIRLLSGMIREPLLTEATVNAERPIVMAERRERDGPDFRINEASRQHFFAGQLLGERSTIGTEETLAAANASAVQAFHHRWYRPERVVIAIAGDMDPALFEQAIVSNFADWRATGPAPTEPDFGQPDPARPTANIIVEPTQPMVVHLATIRPWQRVTDSVAYTQGLMLDTLASLIINRRLEERARGGASYLAAQVSTDKPSRSADMTTISIIPLESNWQRAIDDTRAVVAVAMATPPSEADIQREFADVETFLRRELANAQNEPGTKQADDLLNAVDIGETVTSPDHALAIWQSIRPLATPQRMLEVTRAIFNGPVTRVHMTSPVPIEGGEAALAELIARPPSVAAASAAGRTTPNIRFADLPSPGRRGALVSRTPIERFDLERWEFGNGVTALVRSTDIEPNKIRITVRFGGGRRAVSATGTNLLWAGEGALVESGIGRFDQTTLDRLVSGRQIGMRFSVGDDAFTLSAETRPEDLADQLRLLVAKLTQPGWQPAPVQRTRAARLASYDAMRNSPMAVLEGDMQSLLFSGDRRFAVPSRSEVEALTPAAFRRFWEPLLAEGPVEVQIFGDVSGVDLQTMMLDTFGALRPRPPVRVPPGADDLRPTPVPATPLVARHSGGETQAAAVLAFPTGGGLGAIRTARQLDILAAIYNDRLYERLRDQAGASYSQAVTSNWSLDFPNGSYIFVGGLVKPEDSGLMLQSATAIAQELMTTPVTDDELRRAIGPAMEQIIRASSGNVFWMIQTEGASRDPRRIDALRTYLTDLNSVTPEDIQRLAQTYLRPERGIPLLILPESAAVPAVTGTGQPR